MKPGRSCICAFKADEKTRRALQLRIASSRVRVLKFDEWSVALVLRAKILLAFYAVRTPREFTSRGELSVSQSHNYPAKRGGSSEPPPGPDDMFKSHYQSVMMTPTPIAHNMAYECFYTRKYW